jgi:hypothetical protein
MMGVYQILSPSNKIYIGQSTNIESRWCHYKNLNCCKQHKLYRSLKKYGWEQHIFKVIEECSLEQLNKREIYWGLHYSVLGENGLNLRLGEANGLFSEETKKRMSISKKGKANIKLKNLIRSDKTKQKISNILSKPILQYDLEGNFIREWQSMKEASISLNICSPLISKVCRNEKQTAGGYIWKFNQTHRCL